MSKFQNFERKINRAFEDFIKMHHFTIENVAIKLEEESVTLRNYLHNDRCTLLTVAKQCQMMRWPFFSPQDCSTGEYIKTIKDWLIEAELSTTHLLKLAYPGLKKTASNRYRNTLYQGFSSKSFTAFHCACIRRGLGRPTVDPMWLLDSEEAKDFLSDFEDPKKIIGVIP